MTIYSRSYRRIHTKIHVPKQYTEISLSTMSIKHVVTHNKRRLPLFLSCVPCYWTICRLFCTFYRHGDIVCDIAVCLFWRIQEKAHSFSYTPYPQMHIQNDKHIRFHTVRNLSDIPWDHSELWTFFACLLYPPFGSQSCTYFFRSSISSHIF